MKCPACVCVHVWMAELRIAALFSCLYDDSVPTLLHMNPSISPPSSNFFFGSGTCFDHKSPPANECNDCIVIFPIGALHSIPFICMAEVLFLLPFLVLFHSMPVASIVRSVVPRYMVWPASGKNQHCMRVQKTATTTTNPWIWNYSNNMKAKFACCCLF